MPRQQPLSGVLHGFGHRQGLHPQPRLPVMQAIAQSTLTGSPRRAGQPFVQQMFRHHQAAITQRPARHPAFPRLNVAATPVELLRLTQALHAAARLPAHPPGQGQHQVERQRTHAFLLQAQRRRGLQVETAQHQPARQFLERETALPPPLRQNKTAAQLPPPRQGIRKRQGMPHMTQHLLERIAGFGMQIR